MHRITAIMGFFRPSKINSDEFIFLSQKLESFEKSARDMSENLEKLLNNLSGIIARHDERIKVESNRSMFITEQLSHLGKDATAAKLIMASLTGGIAVLTFVATESGLVKLIIKMNSASESTPPAIERVIK